MRDTKVKRVTGHITSIMFSELEYQEELISEMKPDDVEFLEPSHDTLKDRVENAKGHDEHSDVMLKLEDKPQFKQLYTDILSRFKYILKVQTRKLDRQKGMIDEQMSTVFELEAQKRKIASDLKTAKLALTLEFFGEDSEEYASL
ncbi:unnamed protein product [Penicillium egyptiacum]|uniref:Uncharacterized protein n=1 Tax=Penicillium egyptiacum TaxID=1303716 RepID=A0A9W4K5A5_9EURO|nr:unnamed protein product [Penicillium egyptiacum]